MIKKKRIMYIALIILITFFLLSCSMKKELKKDTQPNKVENTEKKSKEDEPKYTYTTIMAVGDIMFHIPQVKAGYDYETKEYDFKEVFDPVKKYLQTADVSIGNFETTTAGDKLGFTGFPRFNSPKATVKALKYVGLDILSTANNHSLDMGKSGIIETIDNINKNKIENLGTSKEPGNRYLMKEQNNVVLSFLSYTYALNGLKNGLSEKELSYMVNLIDEDRMKKDILEAKEKSDKVIVYIHWGDEYRRTPNEYQVELKNKLFHWGADIILGSHPHVIQKSKIEEINGERKFIIYSMGNFISNQRRETLTNTNRKYTEDGVIVEIVIRKNLNSGESEITDVGYIPTWVYKYYEKGNWEYRILPAKDYMDDKKISDIIRKKLEMSYNNTIKIMDKLVERE